MSNWTYTLTDHEMDVAEHIGRLRCLTAKDDDSTDDTGIHKTYKQRVDQNVMACVAELAVSRLLNSCWTAMAWKQPDVGGYIEVRSIDSPNLNLVVRAFDKDDSPMVLVHVKDNFCTVKGWEKVARVKQFGIYDATKGLPYWRTHKDFALRSMDELFALHIKRVAKNMGITFQ